MRRLARARAWAAAVKRDVVAVYFAARDARTPTPVRWLALVVAAYALSPIDLIPDFIPVLGLLDDLLLVPAGLWLVVRLLPPEVLAEARRRAEQVLQRPRSVASAAVIVALWLAAAALLARWWLGGRA
jgi:uncharacterized membrane protein YkvA (DUF1232 family)